MSQQMIGLSSAVKASRGRTVLDLGCAEALVAREFLAGGAKHLTGVEIVTANAHEASRQLAGLPAAIVNENLDDWVIAHEDEADHGRLRFDVVLALAILHKLRDPARAIRLIGQVAGEFCVIRTAERTPGYVQDARSGDRHIPILAPLRAAGLHFKRAERGPFNEWTGYFVRRG